MKHMSLLLIGVFVLLGCSSNKKQEPISKSGVPVINLSENVSTVPSLLLSEAASKVDIVPLEVTDESLLGEIYHLQITENDIWVHHYKDKCICRFSRSGKFLNKVGKIGQGPGEFIQLSDFFIDEKHREIYIVSASRGIFVYDFDGNFKRQPTRTIVETMFGSVFNQFMIYNNHFFILQNLPLYREIPKDSLWSLALVDSSYKKKKIFKNPVHIGKEDQIYSYDSIKEELVPQYAIFVDEEKGDYEYTHLWFRDRKAFDYFSIHSYYSTKENIYLVGSKGEEVYIYCYNKQEKNVRLQKQQGEITERDVPWFSIPFRRMECPFVLSNDLCGGDFIIDFRSSGKYWVDVLYLGNDGNRVDLNQIKSSTVIDESKKKELIRVLESATEDSNPILMIATLK